MASSEAQLRSRLYEAFSRLGFFIFTRGEQSQINKLLRDLNIHRYVRVRSLGHGTPYMIAEVDYRSFAMECRNSCMKDHILDRKCYTLCKEAKEHKILKEILIKLENRGGEV